MKAVVTGATSGIGAAYAELLAKQGADLIVVGRREKKLEGVAQHISESYGVDVHLHIADFATDRGIQKTADVIHGVTDLTYLINCAGYGTTQPFLQMSIEENLQMLRVHNEAPIRFCKVAIDTMLHNGTGYIVNVSSIAGFIPAPGSQMYTSTKAFLTVFSESLALAVLSHGVHVQALCPGFTHTDFHERLSDASVKVWEKPGTFWMDAGDVARLSHRRLMRKSGLYIPGLGNKLLYGTIKLLPRGIYYAMASRIGS